jgi:hypothetical protein
MRNYFIVHSILAHHFFYDEELREPRPGFVYPRANARSFITFVSFFLHLTVTSIAMVAASL